MVNCEHCRYYSDSSMCHTCKHGEYFDRIVQVDKVNVSVRDDLSYWGKREFCGHCGYECGYAASLPQFYCIRCGGLNTRTIAEFID